jgi:hypothetical protein
MTVLGRVQPFSGVSGFHMSALFIELAYTLFICSNTFTHADEKASLMNLPTHAIKVVTSDLDP